MNIFIDLSVPGKLVVTMSDQKPPFVFNNYPLLCLFKLTATSQINPCPTQTQDTEWRCSLFFCSFLPALICMHNFSLRGLMWLPWKYVTICNISLLRAAMIFPVNKRILHAEHMHWHLRWGEWRFSSQFSLMSFPKTQTVKIQASLLRKQPQIEITHI